MNTNKNREEIFTSSSSNPLINCGSKASEREMWVEVPNILSEIQRISVCLACKQASQLIRYACVHYINLSLSAAKTGSFTWNPYSTTILAYWHFSQDKMFCGQIFVYSTRSYGSFSTVTILGSLNVLKGTSANICIMKICAWSILKPCITYQKTIRLTVTFLMLNPCIIIFTIFGECLIRLQAVQIFLCHIHIRYSQWLFSDSAYHLLSPSKLLRYLRWFDPDCLSPIYQSQNVHN